MSAVGNLWLGEYERIADDYIVDAERWGEEIAREEARDKLRRLGFDENEIAEQLEALEA